MKVSVKGRCGTAVRSYTTYRGDDVIWLVVFPDDPKDYFYHEDELEVI